MSTSGDYVGTVDADYLNLLAEMLQKDKQRTYELMRVASGDHVLDVGCGTGVDTLALAEIIGPNGLSVGLDYDAAMITKAKRRASSAGLARRVHFDLADAVPLPFVADTFAATRSERLFQHLAEPEDALAEMVRVTRPGGWIVVLDPDHGSFSMDFPDSDLERRLARFRSDLFRNGYSGRQLYRQFRQEGLSDIHIELRPIYLTSYPVAREEAMLDRLEREAVAAGIATLAEIHDWQDTLMRADADGHFFASVCLTLAAGRKP
jgi:SAM-dependent methyltransferase